MALLVVKWDDCHKAITAPHQLVTAEDQCSSTTNVANTKLPLAAYKH